MDRVVLSDGFSFKEGKKKKEINLIYLGGPHK